MKYLGTSPNRVLFLIIVLLAMLMTRTNNAPLAENPALERPQRVMWIGPYRSQPERLVLSADAHPTSLQPASGARPHNSGF